MTQRYLCKYQLNTLTLVDMSLFYLTQQSLAKILHILVFHNLIYLKSIKHFKQTTKYKHTHTIYPTKFFLAFHFFDFLFVTYELKLYFFIFGKFFFQLNFFLLDFPSFVIFSATFNDKKIQKEKHQVTFSLNQPSQKSLTIVIFNRYKLCFTQLFKFWESTICSYFNCIC